MPDVDLLREHLLGDRFSGPGLIRRVQSRIEEITWEPGPSYRTGSITGVVDQHHDSEEDEGKVFSLLLAMLEWQGPKDIGSTDPGAARAYASAIASYRLTDRDLLIGGERFRKVMGRKGQPHIERVRRQARKMLEPNPPTERSVDKCLELAGYLRDWLGSACDHDFGPMPSDPGVQPIMRCVHCGSRYSEDKEGRWLAV